MMMSNVFAKWNTINGHNGPQSQNSEILFHFSKINWGGHSTSWPAIDSFGGGISALKNRGITLIMVVNTS